MLKRLIKSQSLLIYTFWNLFDKGLVFLLPIIILTLFDAKEEYIQLEYIISIVTIILTFLDIGLNGYIFYFYQKAESKRIALITSQKINAFFYFILLSIGFILLLFDFFVLEINKFLIFIIFRCLFVYFSKYLISYFRLKDKPTNAIYFSLSVNFLTACILLTYYLMKDVFQLSYFFVPQIILVLLTSFFVLKSFKRLRKIKIEFWNYIKNSFLFSWPTMLQVLVMMYLSNYGKIHALGSLVENEAVTLGMTMRISIIIQLAHATFIGYNTKRILVHENYLSIEKKLLIEYLTILLTCFILVVLLLFIVNYSLDLEILNLLTIQFLIVLYTVIWCLYSYFELYFQRINKNIYKLYFVLINGFVFLGLMIVLPYGFLLKLAISLFFSTMTAFLVCVFTLKKLSFKFI